MLQFRDVYTGSEFFHPGSWIQSPKDPESLIRDKEFKYRYILLKSVTKLSEIMIRAPFRILDLDISHSGSRIRGQKSIGSLIRNTVFRLPYSVLQSTEIGYNSAFQEKMDIEQSC